MDSVLLSIGLTLIGVGVDDGEAESDGFGVDGAEYSEWSSILNRRSEQATSERKHLKKCSSHAGNESRKGSTSFCPCSSRSAHFLLVDRLILLVSYNWC